MGIQWNFTDKYCTDEYCTDEYCTVPEKFSILPECTVWYGESFKLVSPAKKIYLQNLKYNNPKTWCPM